MAIKLPFGNRWTDFYHNIRDPNWPDCYNENHFLTLPDWIQQEILTVHDGYRYLKLTDSDIEHPVPEGLPHSSPSTNQSIIKDFDRTLNLSDDFAVYYNDDIALHGTTIGQDFAAIIRWMYPGRRFDHCLDWCAGAGFIGFRLANDGICDKVSFVDLSELCIAACRWTIDHSNFDRDRFNLYLSDTISSIPHTEQFDLVVGNPSLHRPELFGDQGLWNTLGKNSRAIYFNEQFRAHRDLFENLHIYAHQETVCVIQVAMMPIVQRIIFDQLKHLANLNGWSVTRCFREKNHNPSVFYVEFHKQSCVIHTAT